MKKFEELTQKDIWDAAIVKSTRFGNCLFWYIESNPKNYPDRLVYWPSSNSWHGKAINEDDVMMAYFASDYGADKCLSKNKQTLLRDIPQNTKFRVCDEDCVLNNGIFIKTSYSMYLSYGVFDPENGNLWILEGNRKVTILKNENLK